MCLRPQLDFLVNFSMPKTNEQVFFFFFFSTRPSLGLLTVLGPLEVVQIPSLDSALLCSSRAGADLG